MSTRYSIGTLLTFLRRPYFPAGRDRLGEAQLRHLIQLLFLSIAVMLVIAPIVGLIITSVRGELPANVNETIGQANPVQLLVMGVIFAPIIEEVVFRSWLGGARACVIGFPVLISLFALATAVGADLSPAVSVAVAAGLAVLVFAVTQKFLGLGPVAQKAARWTLFPVAFYGSAVMFALLHLSNYDGGLSSPIMLLAVLPQFLVGLVLGYVRMRFGLIHAIVFHAFYNLVLIGMFLMSQSVVDGANSSARIALPAALTLVVASAST